MLSAFSKVDGVHGNVDGPEVKNLFPEKKIIQAGKFRIGLVHGHGKGKTTERRAIEAFKGEDVDCIIYGHSHIPVQKFSDGILLINPGSPTDKRKQKQFSYAILEAGDELAARIIYFGP